MIVALIAYFRYCCLWMDRLYKVPGHHDSNSSKDSNFFGYVAVLLCYHDRRRACQDQYEMVRQQIAARCTITAEQATQELQALLLQSGWVADTSSRCGGYFRPAARYHPVDNGKDKTVDFDADQRV